MKAIAATISTGALIVLSGCAALVSPQIERDQTAAEVLVRSLSCGMSLETVDKALGGKLERLSGGSQTLTHIYRLEFASIWFVFDREGLRSAQIHVVDGLTSLRAEARRDYCGK